MDENKSLNGNENSDAITLAGQMCCERTGTGWHRSACRKAAKVMRKGKFYCGVHDPERADRIARKQERQEVYKRQEDNWVRQARCINVCDGVPTELLEPGLLARLLEKLAMNASEKGLPTAGETTTQKENNEGI